MDVHCFLLTDIFLVCKQTAKKAHGNLKVSWSRACVLCGCAAQAQAQGLITIAWRWRLSLHNIVYYDVPTNHAPLLQLTAISDDKRVHCVLLSNFKWISFASFFFLFYEQENLTQKVSQISNQKKCFADSSRESLSSGLFWFRIFWYPYYTHISWAVPLFLSSSQTS